MQHAIPSLNAYARRRQSCGSQRKGGVVKMQAQSAQPKSTWDRRGAWADGARRVAIGCAILLLLAIVAPRDLARTSWESGSTSINDSPAGYVGLLSLCGVIALVALAVGAWSRRTRIIAALLAISAFAAGTSIAGRYWENLARGVVGLEGRVDATIRPPDHTIHAPPLLPVFLVAAVTGFVCALVLAIQWRRSAGGPKRRLPRR